MVMLVYVAGPYAAIDEGLKLANIGKAKQAAIEIWNNGHACICPHLNTQDFEYYTTLENKDFAELDLLMVEKCDAIVMLPGWTESKGAQLELECAKKNNLMVYYYPDIPKRRK